MEQAEKRRGCILRDNLYRLLMRETLEMAAEFPTHISMSQWYSLQKHAKKCACCAKKFERFAEKARKKNPNLDGPTTLL